MTTIPIYSNTLSMEELKKAIEDHGNGSIPLKIIDNPDKFRSPLSDPNIIGAIIQTGGTVLAALIGVLATLYFNRKESNKTESGGTVIINLQVNSGKTTELSQAKIVIPLDEYKSEAHQDIILKLELHPEQIKEISYVEEL